MAIYDNKMTIMLHVTYEYSALSCCLLDLVVSFDAFLYEECCEFFGSVYNAPSLTYHSSPKTL